jgi:Uma2 family endonuclease
MSVLTVPTPKRVVAPVPTPKRYSVAEFHQMWESGLFDDCRPMLINGEVFEMATPGPAHNMSVGLTDNVLRAIFASGFVVRVQMPLVLGQRSDPVPDIAIVVGSPRDYPTHPTTAELVVEVADTSLGMDTGVKAQLYAASGIADYWVVDLNNRLLIIHRDPRPDTTNPFGASYATVNAFPTGQGVSPLAAPHASVNVADLIP